jgi:hypothetical protein
MRSSSFTFLNHRLSLKLRSFVMPKIQLFLSFIHKSLLLHRWLALTREPLVPERALSGFPCLVARASTCLLAPVHEQDFPGCLVSTLCSLSLSHHLCINHNTLRHAWSQNETTCQILSHVRHTWHILLPQLQSGMVLRCWPQRHSYLSTPKQGLYPSTHRSTRSEGWICAAVETASPRSTEAALAQVS